MFKEPGLYIYSDNRATKREFKSVSLEYSAAIIKHMKLFDYVQRKHGAPAADCNHIKLRLVLATHLHLDILSKWNTGHYLHVYVVITEALGCQRDCKKQ